MISAVINFFSLCVYGRVGIMNSTQIKCFLEIMRCGLNFTRAAQNLFITQPVLSRHIRRLEASLGVSLFDTSNKKAVGLTPAGKILYEFFDNMNRGFEEALAKATGVSNTPSGEIKLAYVYGWDVLDIAAKADLFSEKYPDTNFTFISLSFDAIARGIRNSEYDVAFTTLFSIKDVPDIWVRDIEDSPLMLLYSSGSRSFSEDSHKKVADFKDDPLYVLSFDEVSISLEMYARVFMTLGFTPKVVSLPNFETIFMQIQRGRGYMVISHRMSIKDSPAFSVFPLGFTDKSVIAWRKDNRNAAALKFIKEFMT